jgi:hypothetical protein
MPTAPTDRGYQMCARHTFPETYSNRNGRIQMDKTRRRECTPVAEVAVDQGADFALDKLVQSGRLHHAQADRRINGAKTARVEAVELEPGMDTERQDRRDPMRLQPGRGIGDAAKAIAHRRSVVPSCRRQHQLFVQPLEQAHPEPILQRLHLLADRALSLFFSTAPNEFFQIPFTGFACWLCYFRYQATRSRPEMLPEPH